MWLLAKKKGVSIMVGYVLLVTFAIIIGVLVYQWIKTYIPTEALGCPDEVSIFIKEYTYDCTSGSEKLTITLKNNGLFNTAGYFIHATNDPDQTLATIDLSGYTKLGKNKGGTVLFKTTSENSFKPNDETTNIFDLGDSGIGQIYSIEIIPVRFQEVDNKMRFVSCGGSRVKELITCVECVPDCVDKECGDDGCGGSCPPYYDDCGSGYFCNATGGCEEAPAGCGTGGCEPGETCLNCPEDCGVCCGNGIIDNGEQCDTGNLSGETCESVMGTGWTGELSCYANCTFDTTGCTEGAEIQESIVFVSSAQYTGNLGGISGADAKCNALALASSLPEISGGTFVAWLSDGTTDAKNGIPTDIPFNRTDGATIADNLADLIDGTIDIEISVDENGATEIKQGVWTGTDGFGVAIVGYNCNNWQSSSSGDDGARGKSDKAGDDDGVKWTYETDETCDKIFRLYCFQIS